MNSAAASVVLVLLMVINNCLVQGILETNDASHKCKCRKMSEGIPIRSVKKIFIVPPNGGCRHMECIVTTKSGKKICVDPKCKWLQDVFTYLKRNNATTPNVNVVRQRQDST